jgi:uncharacterized protein (DUF1330 family)
MALEMLVALHVVDDGRYQAYREEMTPLLSRCGGGFGYDLRVSEVLKSESDTPINRVFTIRFPDEDAKEAFFSHPAYLEIKDRLFEPSVAATTVVATYER